MNAHNGKIGQLPDAIREELNHRLEEGEEGASLAVWLNALPEVQAMLAAGFGGVPISETNLSRWRTGPYQHWQLQRERRAIIQETTTDVLQLAADTGTPPTDSPELNRHYSLLLTTDFVVSARNALANVTDPAARCALIQGFLKTLRELRRQDYGAERLKFQQDRWEAEQLKLNQGQADGEALKQDRP